MTTKDTRVRVGSRFWFNGDWQTPDGVWEVVSYDGDIGMYDCAYLSPSGSRGRSARKSDHAPVFRGWFSCTVERLVAECNDREDPQK